MIFSRLFTRYTIHLDIIRNPFIEKTFNDYGTTEPTKKSPFELPGLDLANAARRLLNDWSLLRDMLSRFRIDFSDAGAKLEHYLTTGARLDAIRLAHTVKGLGKSIGANELALLAEQFENELRIGRETSRPAFEAALQAVLEAIATLPTSVPIEQAIIRPSFDKDLIRRMSQELSILLKNSTMVPEKFLDEFRTQLMGHVDAGILDELVARVELFAFMDAERTLEKNRKRVGTQYRGLIRD